MVYLKANNTDTTLHLQNLRVHGNRPDVGAGERKFQCWFNGLILSVLPYALLTVLLSVGFNSVSERFSNQPSTTCSTTGTSGGRAGTEV